MSASHLRVHRGIPGSRGVPDVCRATHRRGGFARIAARSARPDPGRRTATAGDRDRHRPRHPPTATTAEKPIAGFGGLQDERQKRLPLPLPFIPQSLRILQSDFLLLLPLLVCRCRRSCRVRRRRLRRDARSHDLRPAFPEFRDEPISGTARHPRRPHQNIEGRVDHSALGRARHGGGSQSVGGQRSMITTDRGGVSSLGSAGVAAGSRTHCVSSTTYA